MDIEVKLEKTFYETDAYYETLELDDDDNIVHEDVNLLLIESKYFTINGKIHGVHKEWDKNGILRHHSNYLNGKLDGVYQYWNGGFGAITNYKKNKLHGHHKSWDENGWPTTQCNYKNGKYHGKYESWHKNGKLHYQWNWINGKYDGLSQEWDKNGTLIKEVYYVNGKIVHN